MRKYNKKQCSELIKTLEEAHREIAKCIEKDAISAASSLLADCQDAAVSIGNIVELSEGEGTGAVRSLENYCELVYQINEELISGKKVNARNAEKHLRRTILGAQSSINALPTRYEAVFFPYKASMWDSLESIWMAADEDPNCDAYVIPIPYYDRNPDGSFARLHYEADLYPDHVPVTGYAKYNLEEHHPDMIYIHNPYDEYNYVTSVHPNFYSRVLKQYTDCLVYVPYYATSGKMAEGHSFCPSYMIVDYIVVQSKSMIEQFDERVPREKFLPLGSPKFDCVIRLCKNPPEPPAEWKEKLEGKRVYFYNTSIAGMLDDTYSFLKKMEYVFATFKSREDACLLWRPHPLFETTLDSMRPQYRAEYDRIKQRFITQNIGIFDTTADIESTIAQCDAYIGDLGTSVISLFEAAGKAVFLLDNRVIDVPGKDAWKGIYAVYPADDKRFNKAVVMPDDKLFWSPDNDLNYEFFCDLPKDKYHWGFIQAFSFDGRIYVFPRNAQEILIIGEDRNMRHVKLKNEDVESEAFDRALIFGQEYAFLIPKKYSSIVRFEFSTGEVRYIRDVREFLWIQEAGEDRLCACAFSGKYRKIMFSSTDGDTLLVFDIDTLKSETVRTGFGRTIMSMLSEDWTRDKYFWCIPYSGTKVIRWDMDNNVFDEYDLEIEGIFSYRTFNHMRSNDYYFSSYAVIDDKYIFAPKWGNKFVQLDASTGKAEEWEPPFPVYMENKEPHYVTWDRGWFTWNMDGHVCGYVNSPERTTYKIDFGSNKTSRIIVKISEKDIFEQYCKGFFYESIELPVYCKESPWNTLSDIAAGRITGDRFSRDEQLRAFLRINANKDGNCGENVYTHIKRCMG